MAEQQRNMQQAQQMELTKQAGSFASTEQKAIQSEMTDKPQKTSPKGFARSRHLSLNNYLTLDLLQRLTSMHLKTGSELPTLGREKGYVTRVGLGNLETITYGNTKTYNPEESQEGERQQMSRTHLLLVNNLLKKNLNSLLVNIRMLKILRRHTLNYNQSLVRTNQKLNNHNNNKRGTRTGTSEVDTEFLDQLWNEAQADKFSQESFDRLKSMNSADFLKMYFDYRSGVENNQGDVISNEEASQLRGLVGGDEAYTQMTEWAGQNMSEQEIDMYDSIMQRGDKASSYFAMQALKARYTDGVGSDGQLLTGKPARSQQRGFRSQAELVRAMSDPRYDTDPAYRADVAATLESSNIDF